MVEASPVPIQLSPRALLDTLRVGSAAFPIGAFAYSQGLESAIALGDVKDAETASRWVTGLVSNSVLTADVPLVLRLHRAWSVGSESDVLLWNGLGRALRGTRELRAEDDQLGASLMRLLARLGDVGAARWGTNRPTTLPCAFALFTVSHRVGAEAAALAYAFAWAESQVGAATRSLPLGQTDAQRLLATALDAVADGFARALLVPDSDISVTAHGQSIFSSLHETEYSRLFRS